MVKKTKDNEYTFLTGGKEVLVKFNDDGSIVLNSEVISTDCEVVFDSIKDFRVFCNAITDIIEFNDNANEVKNGKV